MQRASAAPKPVFRLTTHPSVLCRVSLLSLLPLVMLALCCNFLAAATQPAFPLHTAGRFIVDSNGERVHLNGVSWYGAESTDFVVAGLQVASLQTIVQEIAGQGFDAVRLPWSNELYEANPVVGNYALAANPTMEGEHALTILDQVISALTDAGVMVILDNHNSDAEWCCGDDGNDLWYNSNFPEANWLSDWQGMAQRYKSNPLVIGADLRNEPRVTATWGGSATTDWHAAAQRGGNAILSVNPNLLIFVEGVNYATDLSGVSSLPVQLNTANQLVYAAHDYGFDYSGLTGYSDWVSRITPNWGYLISGSNPQPLWLGEFGTCNTPNTCINSTNPTDLGFWFNIATTYLQQYSVDWSYWAINGTQSTGTGRTYGAQEGYGVLDTSWAVISNPVLSTRLADLTPAASPSFALLSNGNFTITPGQSGSSDVSIVPQSGFTGTVSLTCSVSGGPTGGSFPPGCAVPASESVTGSSAVDVTVSITTTGSSSISRTNPPSNLWRMSGGFALASLLLIGIPARRRKMLLSILMGAAIVFSVSSCSSNSSPSGNSTSTTSAGTYTVTVTATAAGAPSVTTLITVNVQ
jgi:endoglucanase